MIVQGNTIQENACEVVRGVGIFIDLNSTAEITGNTIVRNRQRAFPCYTPREL